MSLWDEVARAIESFAERAQWRADQIVTQLSGGQVAPATGDDPGTVVLSDSNPAGLGTTDPGDADDVSRSDHVHPHGALAGGTLHSQATSSAAGFVPAASGAPGDILGIVGSAWAVVTPGTPLDSRWEPVASAGAILFDADGDVIMTLVEI